jgi:hypothetical protein
VGMASGGDEDDEGTAARAIGDGVLSLETMNGLCCWGVRRTTSFPRPTSHHHPPPLLLLLLLLGSPPPPGVHQKRDDVGPLLSAGQRDQGSAFCGHICVDAATEEGRRRQRGPSRRRPGGASFRQSASRASSPRCQAEDVRRPSTPPGVYSGAGSLGRPRAPLFHPPPLIAVHHPGPSRPVRQRGGMGGGRGYRLCSSRRRKGASAHSPALYVVVFDISRSFVVRASSLRAERPATSSPSNVCRASP